MLTGLGLRRAILEALRDYQKERHETPMRQEDLVRKLGVDVERLEAHYVFLERNKYVSFLHMPGPTGDRMRFLQLTPAGEKYLKNAKNFERAEGLVSPFKVVEKPRDEKPIADAGELRRFIESTEWVLDEEKPPILQKLGELEKALEADPINPAAVGDLKLWFERHRWLAPHVSALVQKRFGF